MQKAIDSHVHIWSRRFGETYIAETQYPVLKTQSFTQSELSGLLTKTHAVEAVLVHGPATVAHTAYCLKLCSEYDFIRSVIGWIDLRSDKFWDQLDTFSSDPNFRGVRLCPERDEGPGELLRSYNVKKLAQRFSETGQILEILAADHDLRAVADLAASSPETKIVINHFGLASGFPRSFETWRDVMARLANFPSVFVKVSGLPLTRDVNADFELTSKYLGTLLSAFSAERLLYASNWPVVLAHHDTIYWRRILSEVLQAAEQTENACFQIYRGCAQRLY